MPRKRQRPDNDEVIQGSSEGLRLTRSRACKLTRFLDSPHLETDRIIGTECKKQKTKCETKAGEPSCIRCLRFGLECISYDVSQQFLQSDAT